jgi:hypothetical protein
MRRLGKILAVVAVLYLALAGGLLWAMYQPPATFGRVMKHVPTPAYVVFPFKQLWFVARKGSLRVGDAAPDFSLPTFDHKEQVRLSSFRGEKPVVLVFGSYTWPPFRREVPALNTLYQKYKDKAAFYVVYIQEAHPSDGWQMPSNLKENIVFANPKVSAERTEIAGLCVLRLGIQFPALVDRMENTTEAAYTGWPDRLYVIDRDGRVAYKSATGPFGFEPTGVAETLARLIPASQ